MPKLFPETMIVASSDRRACRALLRTGSRSFFAASHLLPKEVREPATALYAFCRLADDAVDESGRDSDRRAALSRLTDRLDRAYAGTPRPLPADRAFAETVQRFDVPRVLPEALLEGLAWDAQGRRYETLSDLLDYAARVAGAVGAMMTVVMGVRDKHALARACDLGAAMQLTNIARDIGEDAAAGRIYLPLAWLREAGVDPDTWLATPRFHEGIADVTRRVLDEADKLYRRGEAGIRSLPLACRPGIRAARYLYAEIGSEVRRRGYNSVDGRAVVAPSRKLSLCLRAAMPHASSEPTLVQAPPQAETRFLVDAVRPSTLMPKASVADQVVWVVNLFERIEQRRAARQPEGGVT